MPMNFGSQNVGSGWGPGQLNADLLKYFDQQARSGMDDLAGMVGGAIGGGVAGARNASLVKAGNPVAAGEPVGWLSGAGRGLVESAGGEEYKRIKDVGRSADTFIKALGEEGYKKIGMTKDQWDTLGARDKGNVMAGMFKAQAMQDLWQGLQQSKQKQANEAATNRDVAGFAAKLQEGPKARTRADWEGVYDKMLTEPTDSMVPAQDRSRITSGDIMGALEQHPRALPHVNAVIGDILRWQDRWKGTAETDYQKQHMDFLMQNLQLEKDRLAGKQAAANTPPPASRSVTTITDPETGAAVGYQIGDKIHWKGQPPESVTQTAWRMSKENALAAKQAELGALLEARTAEPDNKKRGRPDWLPGGKTVDEEQAQLEAAIERITKELNTLRGGRTATSTVPNSGGATNAPAGSFGDFERWKSTQKR